MLLFVSLQYTTSIDEFSGHGSDFTSHDLLYRLWVFVVLGIFLYMGYTDLREMRLPNKANLALLGLGWGRIDLYYLLLSVSAGANPASDSLFGFLGPAPPTPTNALVASLVLAVPLLLTNLIKEGSFGMGDVKLCFCAGPVLGFWGLLQGGLAGLLAAGLYGALALVFGQKKKGEYFPLGPFLLAGFALVLLFG